MLEKSFRYQKPEGKNVCLIVVTHGFVVQTLAEIFHSFYKNNLYSPKDLIEDLFTCAITPKDINDALMKHEYPGDQNCFYCSITAGKFDIEHKNE
jgi:hypothetical protein